MKKYSVRMDEVVLRLGETRIQEANGIGPVLAERIIQVCEAGLDTNTVLELYARVPGLDALNGRDLHARLERAYTYLNDAASAAGAGVGTTKVFAVLVDGEVKALSVATQVATTGPYMERDYRTGEYVEFPEDQGNEYFNLYELAHRRVRAYAKRVHGVVKAIDLATARALAQKGTPYAVYSPA